MRTYRLRDPEHKCRSPIASAGRFEPGMVLCVESLVREEGGREAIKLETQVLVTQTSVERLDTFPWENA